LGGKSAGKAGKVAVASGGDRIGVGDRFTVAFQRTLRVPEDGRTYPLPPGLGRLPIYPIEDLPGDAASHLGEPGSFVIPLYQREALWLGFGGADWKPNAVQVSVGGVNAISGGAWNQPLSANPQNYLVCPQQPWLDGIHAGAGHIRQFVALPLDDPRTVEAQVSGHGHIGGLQLRVFEPLPGRFPDAPPPSTAPRRSASKMGLGAGGKIAQRIHPDAFGLTVWDRDSVTPVLVHIVNSATFAALAGRTPPPTPIDAATYAKHGLPWFDLYDEAAGDLSPAPPLTGVTPTGGPSENETPVEVDPRVVRPIRPRGR
jgi:hypothetical protein